MAFFRRKWTPGEADEWTKEDYIASVLSALAYIALAVGSALSMLLMTSGFIILAIGILLSLAMYYIIDPKLRMISSEYEKRQKEYLQELAKIQRWEEIK